MIGFGEFVPRPNWRFRGVKLSQARSAPSWLALLFIGSIFILDPSTAGAQRKVGCGCRCGITLSAPCGPEDCMRACGYTSPRPESSPDLGRESPSDDDEDQRKREQAAEAERQRAREEQRQREVEEVARKQQEFVRDRDAAAKTLKGADTIKDQSTPTFGLKGVGDTGIKQLAPDKELRDISTAWRQLHCARELTGYALKAAVKKDGPPDLAEVRYLTDEALKALNGLRIGVKCSDNVPPFPKVSGGGTFDTKKLLPAYETMLKDIVTQAERLNAANRELPALSAKENEARQRVDELKNDRRGGSELGTGTAPNPPSGDGDDRIAKAIAEQKAYQEKERRGIEEVVKVQKERESAMAEAMAVLREAQAFINQRTADKTQALEMLRKYEEFNSKAPKQ